MAGVVLDVESCADRRAPYAGLAAWSHHLQRVGLVEDLAQRFPVPRTSPNATPVRDALHGFIVNILVGGRRSARMRRLQDDRAVAAILGLKKGRVCGEDAFVRMMKGVNRDKARTWMAAGQHGQRHRLAPSHGEDLEPSQGAGRT